MHRTAGQHRLAPTLCAVEEGNRQMSHTTDEHEHDEQDGGSSWLDDNRANWDDRVPVHVASDFYDLTALRAGRGRLTPIEESELAQLFPGGEDGTFDLSGLRVLHLQCHFGADTLRLAQAGAEVVGIDFSRPAIKEARKLAAELGLADRARFIVTDVYDLRHALPEPDSFDLVFTSWGTITWLPNLTEWASIIEWFLKPGALFYFADGHPVAGVFDGLENGFPRFAYPYGSTEPFVIDDPSDYADQEARVEHGRTWEWSHTVSALWKAVTGATLRLDHYEEHYEIPWQAFPSLQAQGDGMYRWPDDTRWLPLAHSLTAVKPMVGQTRPGSGREN